VLVCVRASLQERRAQEADEMVMQKEEGLMARLIRSRCFRGPPGKVEDERGAVGGKIRRKTLQLNHDHQD
jgi:hypothetical protein